MTDGKLNWILPGNEYSDESSAKTLEYIVPHFGNDNAFKLGNDLKADSPTTLTLFNSINPISGKFSKYVGNKLKPTNSKNQKELIQTWADMLEVQYAMPHRISLPILTCKQAPDQLDKRTLFWVILGEKFFPQYVWLEQMYVLKYRYKQYKEGHTDGRVSKNSMQ